jgi:hypothetical protein
MSTWRLYGCAAAAGLVLVCAAGGATPPAPAGAPFELFSASEAAAWNKNDPANKERYGTRELPQPGVPSCHDIPGSAAQGAANPQINVLAPTLGKPLAPPLDIDLQFVPAAAGAAIRPETFRVCYVGFITMDITKRITDHVAISVQGIHVAGAQLPQGHHHLVMMIADSQGKIGSRDAVFDIK